jgi:hypothetical protein
VHVEVVAVDADARPERRGDVKRLPAVPEDLSVPGFEPRGELHGLLATEPDPAAREQLELVLDLPDQPSLGGLVAQRNGAAERDELAGVDAGDRGITVDQSGKDRERLTVVADLDGQARPLLDGLWQAPRPDIDWDAL